jgi:hypothetical protein
VIARAGLIALAALYSLAGCEGPKESTGREKDRLIAANTAQPAVGRGPNQLLGEAQDRADRADKKVRDTRADALESEADRVRTQADIAADRLEAQATDVRAGKAK